MASEKTSKPTQADESHNSYDSQDSSESQDSEDSEEPLFVLPMCGKILAKILFSRSYVSIEKREKNKNGDQGHFLFSYLYKKLILIRRNLSISMREGNSAYMSKVSSSTVGVENSTLSLRAPSRTAGTTKSM